MSQRSLGRGTAILRLARGSTTLVITHDLGLAAEVDRILFLQGGRIAEVGSHATLLAQGGGYAGLWALQRGGPREAGPRAPRSRALRRDRRRPLPACRRRPGRGPRRSSPASPPSMPSSASPSGWAERAGRLTARLRIGLEADTGHAFRDGDFSADQVVLTPEGPRILDWDRSGPGTPLEDLGSFSPTST